MNKLLVTVVQVCVVVALIEATGRFSRWCCQS
jgi:hypothetical protein